MITISPQIVKEIIRYLTGKLPNEGCGYLAGTGSTVEHFFPITNRLHSPTEFAFDQSEQFEAVRSARSRGLELIAVVHSHPGGTAQPSQMDIIHADESLVQVIVVPNSEPVEVRAFRIMAQEVREIEILR